MTLYDTADVQEAFAKYHSEEQYDNRYAYEDHLREFDLWLQGERARIWNEALDAYPQAASYAPNPYEEN